MLITTEVQVVVASRTLYFYRNLGYDCKIGDTITVPVERTHNGCNEKIWYKCDICNKQKQVSLKSFKATRGFDEPMYCVECANLLRCGKSIDDIREYISLKARDGYRICKKCNRELPLDIKYFNPDITCADGLRFVCRECSGDPFKTHEDDWSREWTDDELSLLKQHYADCTTKELQEKFFPDRSIRGIRCMGNKLHIAKSEIAKAKANESRTNLCRTAFTGRKLSDSAKEKLSVKARERYEKYGSPLKGRPFTLAHKQNISKGLKESGRWKGENNPRYANPLCGKDNPNWKGGLTPLYQELRSDTRDWFVESGELSNFKCVISGLKLDNVHHLIPFKDIVKEVFDVLNLEFKDSIADYTAAEESQIRNLLKELHIQYGLGVGLNKEVHKLFHDNYGYSNVTKEDFKSFLIGIQNGVYDEYFAEHNLPIMLNLSAIDVLLN